MSPFCIFQRKYPIRHNIEAYRILKTIKYDISVYDIVYFYEDEDEDLIYMKTSMTCEHLCPHYDNNMIRKENFEKVVASLRKDGYKQLLNNSNLTTRY
jgi:hypothetical protein